MPTDNLLVRDKINNLLNTSIVVLTIVALLAVLSSLYRSIDIGWQPVMYVHMLILALLVGVALFRHSLTYFRKSILVLTLFFLAGVVGTLSFGLIGNGILLLAGFVMTSVALLGIRAGIVAGVLSVLTIIISGSLAVSEHLPVNIDHSLYASNTTSWVTALVVFALISGVVLLVIGRMYKVLNETLLLVAQQKETLEETLSQIKQLEGIIPICAYCHSIRDDEGAWDQLENYIANHTDATFSHGVCPKCIDRARSDFGLGKKEQVNS